MSRQREAFLSAMLPSERRTVAVIALISMCRMFGLFALLPVLSIYSKDLDGATPLLIGFAVGGYGLTQALLQIPFGAVSDRLGRVPVILFGLALFAAGSVLAAGSESIWGVIAGRLLQGAGAVSATLTALLADATRAEVRTRSMAFFGVGIGLSFLLALMAGPLIAASVGVRALFWLAALLALVAGLLLLALPPRTSRTHTPSTAPLRGVLRAPLLRLDLYIFLLHVLLTASFVALPFLLSRRLDLPLASHWPLYFGALALSLPGTIPLIVADERRGRTATIAIAVALLLAGELLLGFAATGIVAVALALALFFAGFNFLEAGLPARLSLLADGEVRGAAFGVFSSCQFLGAFAGGLLGGYFLGGGRPAVVFVVCALLAGLWLASLKLVAEPQKSGERA
jgi:MFS family permease